MDSFPSQIRKPMVNDSLVCLLIHVLKLGLASLPLKE